MRLCDQTSEIGCVRLRIASMKFAVWFSLTFPRTLLRWHHLAKVFLEFFDRFTRNLAAINEEAPLGPFEHNPVIPFARDDHLDLIGHLRANGEFRRRVISVMNYRVAVFVFTSQLEFERRNFGGPGIRSTQSPTCDIHMVCNPNRSVYHRNTHASCGRSSVRC